MHTYTYRTNTHIDTNKERNPYTITNTITQKSACKDRKRYRYIYPITNTNILDMLTY